jgi:APA family basic amino acid/polyamine antiporter
LVLVFFIVTAAMARDIGSAAWLNHLVSDWLDYRLAALSYGELAGMMPKGRRSICLHSACMKISVVLYGWTVLPLFRLELLLQLQLRLQTILRYSFRY